MGGVENGLTLEGLAQRLEALEHENARLRDEVAAFRDSGPGRDGVGGVLRTPSAPRADNGAEDGGDQATEVPEVRMDRRRLLKGAAAAAAGLVVAGSLTQRDIREAEAAQLFASADVPGTGALNAENVNAEGFGVYGRGGEAGVFGRNRVNDSYPRAFRKAGVYGEGDEVGVFGEGGEAGVQGNSNTIPGYGVRGSGDIGVYGLSPTGVGMYGLSQRGDGVVGESNDPGNAIDKPGTGVIGRNTNAGAVGVKGEGALSGVEGQAAGDGVGVLGRNASGSNNGVGVQGESPNFGVKGTSPRVGVSGEGPQTNGSQLHIGVRGLSPNGLGGVFGGKRAQLMLNPNATTGRPTSGGHQAGELYMSSTCELYICTRSGGVAVQWRKVQTIPA